MPSLSCSTSINVFGSSGAISRTDTKVAASAITPSPIPDGGELEINVPVRRRLSVHLEATGDLKLVTAYGVRGAFNHNWDPYWSSSLFGAWAAERFGGSSTDITTAKGQWCASYMVANKLSAAGTPLVANAAAAAGGFSCNPDFNIAQVGVITRWTPVKNLTFSAEVGAFFLDQKMTGVVTLTPSAPKPTATYEYKNQSTEYLQVRVQRNF